MKKLEEAYHITMVDLANEEGAIKKFNGHRFTSHIQKDKISGRSLEVTRLQHPRKHVRSDSSRTTSGEP